MSVFSKGVALVLVPMSMLALTGCKRVEDPNAVSQINHESSAPVIAKTTPAAASEAGDAQQNSIQADTRQTLADARQTARDLGDDLKRAGARASEDLQQAGSQASDKVADAVITATVKAELAKDKALSATQINVDTTAGRVALHGTTPSEAARSRATQLALAVHGVVSVDNQLTVQM